MLFSYFLFCFLVQIVLQRPLFLIAYYRDKITTFFRHTQISLIFWVKKVVFIADFVEKCKKNACFSNKFTLFQKVVPLLFPLMFDKFCTFAQFIQPLKITKHYGTKTN